MINKFPQVRYIVVALVTLISLVPVILSLVGSINQPQVQSNLQLYQTNLILQAAEVSSSGEDSLQEAILGGEPYEVAENQYLEALKQSQQNLDFFKNRSKNTDLVAPQIKEQEQFIDDINLKLGMIEIAQSNAQKAFDRWDELVKKDTQGIAFILEGLWSDPPLIAVDAEAKIKQSLQGWFQDQALQQLYEVSERSADFQVIQERQETLANQALVKLSLVATVPILGGLVGVGLLIFLLFQIFFKGKESILGEVANLAWETPWDWQIIWLVLGVGFFFLGQVILPVIFGGLGISLRINPVAMGLRIKAFYVLITYLVMATSGIAILYLSIKRFFPLPKDWFRFDFGQKNWLLWGGGGYLVALPLVVLVSLLNQQIWQGQGGSNPLLLLALESQDWLALALFFVTASLLAPIFEEIMFRGFLLPSLTRYLPVWGAIVSSGLIFAIAHLSLSEVLPLTTLGIILGVVYTRSRNLLASILLHSLWNSGTLISLFILGSSSSS
jgi:membrane protease YdiL (CAAX protease family)